jgi:LuxR family transcriptional regulator, maltose regulon positive regulatory protein
MGAPQLAALADRQVAAATAAPLLATKLTPPRTPARLVSRPRLFTLLDAGTRQLLTVLSGPAGAGKTTLLTSWCSAAQPPGPVAWLSLDPGDDEPARFWTYLQAALCRSGAVPADSTLRSLAPRPGLDETFLSLLVSGLADLPTPVVLVLDDLQDISDPAVFRGLKFLLRHAPEQLRLVLSTRVDPPLPLHRLLVSGQLSQVRSADLVFTVAEVAELLAEYEFQPGLDEHDAALLQARTEGWAVGLRLAALSLQGEPDPHRFVAEFAGDDRSVADYLVGEVLDRQPEELRRFLLQTCIVEELSGDLADALTGGHDGEWTLARLERANAFVAALGPRRGAYRYHQLFAGLLRCELRRQAPDQVAGLHRRAARWYAANGRGADAIRQALLAGEWRDAADLMAEHGLHLVLHGAAGILDELERLPADVAQADPELALLVAADGIVRGDLETAAAHLQLAQQQARQREAPPPEDRRRRFAWQLATCRTALAWQVGDLDEALAAGHEALALPAEPGGADDDTRALLLSSLGAAELWSGRLDAAEIHLRQGQQAALRAGLGSLQLGCMSQLAVLHAMRGTLGQAAQLAGEAVELAIQRGWSSSPQAAGGHLALAWVHFHRDDLIEAGNHLERAAAAARAHPERPVALGIAILQARLQQVRGDLAGSLATVAAVRGDATGWTPPAHLRRWLALTEAELHGAAGQPASVPALLDGVGQGGPLGVAEAVVLARLQLAGGDPAAAGATLAPCLDGTAPGGLVAPVEAWLLDAIAGDALADQDRATASLQRALSLAEAEGFRRSLLDAGAPGRSLLARYRHRLATSGFYLDELLQASVESVHAEGSPPVLVGQLTKQERVVLRYLPSSMTYEEIATDLYLSPNTVKSHVYSVFRKLGVNGRRHAVRSARELRLL